jgi:hypothetical protein
LITDLKVLGDSRGKLIAIESSLDVPFEIKRVFYIYGTQPNVSRGRHAHYKTKQYLIAVHGHCTVMLDNGEEERRYSLDSPNTGLIQNEMVWGEMYDFSSDCVLLVLASEHFDEADYINDHKKFLGLING